MVLELARKMDSFKILNTYFDRNNKEYNWQINIYWTNPYVTYQSLKQYKYTA